MYDRTDASFLYPHKVGKPLFPYSVYYVFFQQYNVLWFEILQNFLVTIGKISLFCVVTQQSNFICDMSRTSRLASRNNSCDSSSDFRASRYPRHCHILER